MFVELHRWNMCEQQRFTISWLQVQLERTILSSMTYQTNINLFWIIIHFTQLKNVLITIHNNSGYYFCSKLYTAHVWLKFQIKAKKTLKSECHYFLIQQIWLKDIKIYHFEMSSDFCFFYLTSTLYAYLNLSHTNFAYFCMKHLDTGSDSGWRLP